MSKILRKSGIDSVTGLPVEVDIAVATLSNGSEGWLVVAETISLSERPRAIIIPEVNGVASPAVVLQDGAPAASNLYYGLLIINGGDLPSEAFKFENNIDTSLLLLNTDYSIFSDDAITRVSLIVVADADDAYVTDSPLETELNNTSAQPNVLVFEFGASDNVKYVKLSITAVHALCEGRRYA